MGNIDKDILPYPENKIEKNETVNYDILLKNIPNQMCDCGCDDECIECDCSGGCGGCK